MGSAEKLLQMKAGKTIDEVVNAGIDPLYHLRRLGAFENDTARRMIGGMEKAKRTSNWQFDKAMLLGDIPSVQGNPHYKAAKAGDIVSAVALANDFVSDELVKELRDKYASQRPIIVAVQGYEGTSVNQIPLGISMVIGDKTGFDVDANIVQANRAGHTKSTGWHRIANQAVFAGLVYAGRNYIVVDDFIGQGGTVANIKGHIEAGGGTVIDALILAGKEYSATLELSAETLTALREKHGDLENWWKQRFGFGFDALTESEARYLIRAEDADTIRNKLDAAQ